MRTSTAFRMNFPAVNANGSPLGARSRSIRGSLLPMSPYLRWTFPCGRRILMLLTALRRDFGLSMLFTTHDLGVVRYIADRVAVMYLGKIVEIAPSDTFFQATHHPYSRMLLGSALSSLRVGIGGRKSSVQGEPPSPINPPSGCRFRTRCAFAHARCEREEPLLRSVGPEHSSACHLDQFTAVGQTRNLIRPTTPMCHANLFQLLQREKCNDRDIV